jgi:outer membrane protein assembly factor BamA
MIKSPEFVLIFLVLFFLQFNPPVFGIPPDSTKDAEPNKTIIKNLTIDRIDVAGPSLFDGKDWQPDFFGEAGNFLHVKTRLWVVQNILLFKKGEAIDQQKIDESERLLRKSGYFRDARIEIKPGSSSSPSDVRVVTKDKWTLSPQLSYSAKNKNGYIGIKDINLIGLGHSFESVATYDEDKNIGWGGRFGYSINNIKGSYVDALLKIETNHNGNSFRLNLSRPFFTNTTQWAGGMDFNWRYDNRRFVDRNDTIKFIPTSFDSQDLWLGRSFPVWFGSNEFKNNSRFIISGKYFKQHYKIRPKVLPDSNQVFQNDRLYLFSSGIINRQFYKSYFVDGFGVTEDIPVGSLFSVTTGSDDREFYNRWYFGMQFIYSQNIGNVGYFAGNFELGGFTYKRKWEQNTFRFDLNYHSPILYRKNWKARIFLQNNFVIGTNRFEGEQLFLNRSSGMPGIDDYSLTGIKRNVFNIEARIFSPYSLLGFVLGGIVFADYGMISGEGSLFNCRLYQAYGFGIRTQNESISRTSFEMALVYNPFNPASSHGSLGLVFSASFALGSWYFNFDEPQTVKFSDE